MSEPIDYKALYAASYIDRSRLEAENAALRAQAAAPDVLLKKQRENLRALEQQVLAANSKVKGLEDRITNLIAENEGRAAALRTLRQRHQSMRAALDLCVASLDQLLPHLGKVPADVGLLNEALCAARPLLLGDE